MLLHLNLGSSLEPRREYLERAVAALERVPGFTLLGGSKVYETPACGMAVSGCGPFLNLCLAVKTSQSAERALEVVEDIERRLGRRSEDKGKLLPRTIDIDLVFAGEVSVQTPRLTLPHPGLSTRSFFLWPLLEICPNATLPGSRLALKVFLGACVDPPILATYPGIGF